MRPSPLRCLSLATATALTATACGSGSQPVARSSAGSTVFPLTLTRQGGIAGVDHRAVVARDGQVTVTVKDDSGSCALEDDTLRELASVASSATGTAVTTASHPDDLVVVMATPQGSRRLTDAELAGPAAVVGRLLDDVVTAPAERTLCR
jgi:hypothetical protein